MKPEKPLGQLKSMTIKIDSPIPLTIDNMEFNKLVLLTGLNGTGKTLIMKLNWTLATVFGVHILKGTLPPAIGGSMNLEELTQYTFDHSFDDQNFNGMIAAEYDHGNISIGIDHGKVLSVNTSMDPQVEYSTPVIYMSTNMRTFEQIKQYLKIRKVVESEERMVDFYKLYDIAYIKFLQSKIDKSYTLSESSKEELKKFDLEKYDIQQVYINDDSVFWINSKDEHTDLSTLSKGEQSMINMLLANSIK